MAVRFTSVLFSAALFMAACGKGGDKPGAQPVQAGAEADKGKTEAARAGGEGAAAPAAGTPEAAKPAAPGAPAGAGQMATGAVAAALTPAPNAVVEIIEFSDFQCPFCSRVTPTLKELKTTYGDKLKVTFLHQPLPFHNNARPAALAAEAARKQGKFWEMHDKLFANQQALAPADFERYAGEIGLNVEQFKKDIADPTLSGVVDQHQSIASAVGATGTPAFFINGKNLRGAQPVEEFKKLVDEEIAAAGTNAGDAWIKQRLQANNAPLFSYVYEGKAAPKPEAPKPVKDMTVYKVTIDPTVDAVKGDATAPITMVVFSEFQCPFCKKVEPTLKQLQADYGTKIRTVFKHNPLPFHKDALPASNAALCAKEQGKFWEMHDMLFENQQSLDAASLEKYATDLKLDVAKWKECFTAERYKNQIANDQELSGKVTARGTPNIFINGRKVTGAKPIEEFKEIVDEELKKAEALVAKGIAADKVYEEVIKDGKVFEPLEEKVNAFKLDGSPTKGKKDAKIQIVEFSDFECPFCSRVAAPLKELEAKYGADMSVTFKHFPLSFHKNAMPTAVAAMCAHEQGKFWEFHDQAFANQKALLPENLKEYAKTVGLDLGKFDACVASNKPQAQIEADMAEARGAEVRGTPTLYINGRKFNSPTGYNVDAFSSVIDKYILKK
ncbi:MAG: thioredoxin domain-containing protein [Deltaproteobacteria bacterium]|nr:thioredoxin domain-containing protein [Deltaproteobacteria bacterium]